MRRIAPIALLLLASCATSLYVQHQQATLFFGMAKPDKSPDVTTAEWDAFIAEVVTPKFPGFTILDSTGYWKGEREKGKIVIFVDGGDREADLLFIMDEYKKRFNQEAVLLVREPVWVRFH